MIDMRSLALRGDRIPLACQWEITCRCNLRCVMCYTDCFNRPDLIRSELETSEILRIMDELADAGCLDLILTGRGVSGDGARWMGLANRLVDPGRALEEALALGRQLAGFPQRCLRSDRRSALEQWSLPLDDALAREMRLGLEVLASGESAEGAGRFARGAGRHGSFGS